MKPFRERNPVIIGAISIAVILLLMLGAFRASDLPLIGGGDTYYARFTEAGGLEPSDEVRIAGVRVGQVEDVSLDNDEVLVRFRVKTDSPFGPDTGAAIQIKTLLGAMYLSLEPAGDGQLTAGDTIPASRTTSPFDVVDAFMGLAETSADIDTDQLAGSLTTLADLTRDSAPQFKAALRGISELSGNLADRDDQINSLLTNLKRVSTVLSDRDDDIITLMQDADVLFRSLVARRSQIHDLLVSTSQLSSELTTLVRRSRDDLKPALTRLDSVVDVLNKNTENIDSGLRLLAPFYRVFANTLGTGPWFDTFIENLPPVPALTGGGVGVGDGGVISLPGSGG